MRVLILASLLQVTAAIAAVMVARRRLAHRPVAVFLVTASVANVALLAFTLTGAPTTTPAQPLTGVARAVGHLRQAIFLVWPFGLAAMFTALFSRRLLWPFAVAYTLTLGVLVAGYPAIRGDALRKAYLGTELGAIAVALGALIPWSWKRRSPTFTQGIAVLILFGEGALLIGPWSRDIFAGWDMGRVMYAVIYAALTLIQGSVLWKPSRSS